MRIEKWHANRMGLVDFWCYNDEEFKFQDGHMLLRGSNGSGKSVTMQSFIPLLLDGNKSSERLDPFGTRSRKMDTYLIDENSDRDERIGYLYLEFKKENCELYKTIGMGLHAKRGKPLKSWYFVIEDNRRVNIDFRLMDKQLTLSEKQLRNVLGNDQVISLQSEYMKRVNDALFGFENLEEYSDAISLLLQLRSPKLSNSLTPQKINEILARSLQPLSDEDLRPMSEAIVNMDNLQDQLDNLKQSQASASILGQAYDTYNKSLLLEKTNKYVESQKENNNIKTQIKNKEDECENKKKEIEKVKQDLKQNKIDFIVAKEELDSLKTSDMDQWVETITKLKQENTNLNKNKIQKEKNYEQKQDLYQDLKRNLKIQEDKRDSSEIECKKSFQEMETINNSLQFSEHIAITQSFQTKEKDFNFNYTQDKIKSELKNIQEGIKKWTTYDEINQRVTFYKNKRSEYQDQLDKILKEISKSEEEYKSICNQYIEFMYQYDSNNQVLKFAIDDLEKIRDLLIDYENTHDFMAILNILQGKYHEKNTEILQNDLCIKNELAKINETINELKKELNDWISKDDIEPERSLENKKNREYLDTQGISYLPFYKAIDFAKEMNEQEKDFFEELLIRLNLLDAIIINETDQNKVINAPKGCSDYYLFTNYDVSKIKPVIVSGFNSQGDLDLILKKLGIFKQNQLFISNNYFQSGVIQGTLSQNIKSMYVGYFHRLQIKQEKIEGLKLELEIQKENSSNKMALLEKNALLKQKLDEEYSHFITENDIKESINKINDLKRESSHLDHQIAGIQNDLSLENKRLARIFDEISTIARHFNLISKKEFFIAYENDLDEYLTYFEIYKDNYKLYHQVDELCFNYQEQISRITQDLDELNYEIDELNQKTKINQSKQCQLQKQLEEAGYLDISKKVEDLKKRLDRLENEKTKLEKDEATLETIINYIKQEINHFEDVLKESDAKLVIYKAIFEQELNLNLVYSKENSVQNARNIVRELASQISDKKTVMDYQNQLQRVYFEQNMYLTQYNLIQENYDLCHQVDGMSSRILLKATNLGQRISFNDLLDILKNNIEMQELLIVDEDRHIFEEILVNTIGKRIRDRIAQSKQWVEKIQNYMNDLNTSSGLQLSIRWKSKKAINNEELDTKELVELLEKDYQVLRNEDKAKISNHFRNNINTARKLSLDENTMASFHQLMRDVMDYRKWFDFTLYAKKPNETRKELTSNVFFAYSGGEKALSMYIPLFSAVAAKFESARKDAPLLIALDEAFAGVDENNIDNMFSLITKFNFDYIMNSQDLWGEYPSCPSLAIYELFRPNNAPYVTVIAYIWNGHSRRMLIKRQKRKI